MKEYIEWKVTWFWAWYDMWVGLFVDTKKKTIYICPIPCFVIKIVFNHYYR